MFQPLSKQTEDTINRSKKKKQISKRRVFHTSRIDYDSTALYASVVVISLTYVRCLVNLSVKINKPNSRKKANESKGTASKAACTCTVGRSSDGANH